MSDAAQQGRQRQMNRLGGAKTPTARAALALAKSPAYQDAADAPATLRAYRAGLANFSVWCATHGFPCIPATPVAVGAGDRNPANIRDGLWPHIQVDGRCARVRAARS